MESNKKDATKEELELINEAIEFNKKIEQCNKLLKLQLSQMSMNQISNESVIYMGGMYNGMELIMSVLEDRQPMFCDLSVNEIEGDEDKDNDLGVKGGNEIVVEKAEKTISGMVL